MSELTNIRTLLDRSLQESLPADKGWLLVYEARDRLRALESALGSDPPSARGLEDLAQTRTPEESSRSSRHSSGSYEEALASVAESPKESAPPGPARAATEDGDARPVKPSSGRGPRRSADFKAGIEPIERKA